LALLPRARSARRRARLPAAGRPADASGSRRAALLPARGDRRGGDPGDRDPRVRAAGRGCPPAPVRTAVVRGPFLDHGYALRDRVRRDDARLRARGGLPVPRLAYGPAGAALAGL